MIASVSTAARVSRCGFTRRNRRTYSAESGSVRNCQPPATSCSTMPLTPVAVDAARAVRAPRDRARVDAGRLEELVERERLVGRRRARSRARCAPAPARASGSLDDQLLEGLELGRLLVDVGGVDVLQLASPAGAGDRLRPRPRRTATALPGRSSPGFFTCTHVRRPPEPRSRARRPSADTQDVLRPLVLEHADAAAACTISSSARNVITTCRARALPSNSAMKVIRSPGRSRSAMPCIAADRLTRSRTTSWLHPGLERLEHPVQRLDQLVDAHLGQAGLFDGICAAARASRGGRRRRGRACPALGELLGRVLVLLVLEQPAHQLGARVALLLRGVAGSPAARPCRGSSIRLLRWASVAAITRNSPAMSRLISRIASRYCEVLLGDERDGDVEDVELVLADQVQQQIERALEVGQRDAERVPGWRVSSYGVRARLAPRSPEISSELRRTRPAPKSRA